MTIPTIPRAGGPILPGGRTLAIVVFLGVVLRVLLVFSTPVFPTVANTWDSNFYHESAVSLAQGEGYRYQGHPTAFFPPAFPFLLSGAYRLLGEDPRSGQILNLLLSLLLAGATGAWVSALGGRRAGRIAFMAMLLEPSQLVMPAFLMSETLCAAAIMAAFACYARWGDSRRLGWALAGAGAMTLAGMTRGHAFLLLPGIFLVLRFAGGVPWRRLVLPAALCAIVAGGTLGLWTARNLGALGHPVPIATNGGINLLLGNNPEALGGRADPPGGVPQTGDEVEDERIARERAMDWIRENPGRFVLMMPVKVFRLWAFAPSATYRHELQEKWGRIPSLVLLGWAQVTHVLIVLLTVLFLRSAGRRGPGSLPLPAWWIAVMLLIWTAGHLPFLGGARYLFPVQPLLLAGAAFRSSRD